MNFVFSLENYHLADAGCSLRRIWDLSLKERVKIALVALDYAVKSISDSTPEPDSLLALNDKGAFIAEFSDHLPLFERLYLEIILLVRISGRTETEMLEKLVEYDLPHFFLSDIESAFYCHSELSCDRMKNTFTRMLMIMED